MHTSDPFVAPFACNAACHLASRPPLLSNGRVYTSIASIYVRKHHTLYIMIHITLHAYYYVFLELVIHRFHAPTRPTTTQFASHDTVGCGDRALHGEAERHATCSSGSGWHDLYAEGGGDHALYARHIQIAVDGLRCVCSMW